MIIERGARPDALPDARAKPKLGRAMVGVGIGLALGLGLGVGLRDLGKRTSVAAPTLRQEFEVMLARWQARAAEPKWGVP